MTLQLKYLLVTPLLKGKIWDRIFETKTALYSRPILVSRIRALETEHEEAEIIVVAQAIYAADIESKKMAVVTYNADIHVLLLHHLGKNTGVL